MKKKETFTISADKIKSSALAHSQVRDDIYFKLPRNMCQLFGWTKLTTVRYFQNDGVPDENVNVARPAENLIGAKRGSAWSYDRTLTTLNQSYHRYDIPWQNL